MEIPMFRKPAGLDRGRRQAQLDPFRLVTWPRQMTGLWWAQGQVMAIFNGENRWIYSVDDVDELWVDMETSSGCWLEPWNFQWLSHHIGNFIIPTDVLIFFRGVGIPPTCSIIGYLMIFFTIWDFGGYHFWTNPCGGAKALTLVEHTEAPFGGFSGPK